MRNFKRIYALPVLAALLFVLPAGSPAFGRSDFGVSFNVNLGPPPVIVSPPDELALIPGTQIYYLPDTADDIFFYGGYWWAPRGPRWYRAYSPAGPWVIVRSTIVPAPLYHVPHDYRVVYRSERVPYGHWKRMHHRDWGDRDRRGWGERDDRHWRDRDRD